MGDGGWGRNHLRSRLKRKGYIAFYWHITNHSKTQSFKTVNILFHMVRNPGAAELSGSEAGSLVRLLPRCGPGLKAWLD